MEINTFYNKMGGYCPSCLKTKTDCDCLQDYLEKNGPKDFNITISKDKLKELIIQAHYNGQPYSLASIRMSASYANRVIEKLVKK